MRIAGIIGAAMLLGGCALFDGGDRPATAAASVSPARVSTIATSARQTREPFRPAFGAGQPVALVPCTDGVALSAGCRNLNDRHQRRGDMPEGEEAATFTEASALPISE
ncbi:MAG: hypothetical protein ACOZAA_17435 [Pseudomonadota bacterium]